MLKKNIDLDRITHQNIEIITNSLEIRGAKSIPLNVDNDGTAYTITTRCGSVAWSNLLCGGGHYPSTSVLEINNDE